MSNAFPPADTLIRVNMKKNSITVVPLAVLVLSLPACGKSQSNAAENTGAAPTISDTASTATQTTTDTTAKHHSVLAGALAGAAVGHVAGHHAIAGAAVGALVQHERNKQNR